MPRPNIEFVSFDDRPVDGTAVILVGEGRGLGEHAPLVDPEGSLEAVFDAADFSGKASSSVNALALPGSAARSVTAMGVGDPASMESHDWLKLGGAVYSKAPPANGEEVVAVLLETADGAVLPRDVAQFALGMSLRSYRFDRYKTRRKSDDNGDNGAEEADKSTRTIRIVVADDAAARDAFAEEDALAAGVELARDLVNEPPNLLGTEEFKDQAAALGDLGVEIEVLDETAMRDLGMGSLLCVAQGSERPPYLVVMRWNGGGKDDRPLAFVGKGVVFDSGGISIKPGAGMGDMKGDMAGAAAVTGLMRAVAGRKAKANVVGVIGLVENMPDGRATRPGDIVTSMSGQTIEVLNTDAEGRLVLADALTYTRREYAPQFMINLATLTGAILVALGQEHAGLFSNDDDLADQLFEAGQETQEKVWRMPLCKAYDKLIDTKNADMKNIGGRFAGSITAAQFLQRFVEDTPWAHLDVAGTAMNSPSNEYSQSWASGFGVRLLDRLVRNHYEG